MTERPWTSSKPRTRRIALILFYGCFLILMLGGMADLGAEDRCAEVEKTLDHNTMRLKEYAIALNKAHRDKDFKLITVLNNQIDETLQKVRTGEAELLNCPPSTGVSGPAISSVKSHDSKFSGGSCDELKKKHIQLLRKFNSLSRRRKSVLSELSPEERIELREIEDSLNAVESELKKRCGPPPTPKPFQRRSHPAGEKFR